MNKHIKFLMGKSSYIVGLAMASLVGGLVSAVVLAAIPDSSGTIHACYKNSTGALKVIDSSTNSCAGNETALNWSQNGSAGTVLHDANGQVLGDLVDYAFNTQGGLRVYNHTLGRLIGIAYDFTVNQYVFGDNFSPTFQSSDCSGQPYFAVAPYSNPKTAVVRWSDGTTETHAIVSTSAQVATITDGSDLIFNGETDTCQTGSGSTPAYPLTTVSLPFSSTVVPPFTF